MPTRDAMTPALAQYSRVSRVEQIERMRLQPAQPDAVRAPRADRRRAAAPRRARSGAAAPGPSRGGAESRRAESMAPGAIGTASGMAASACSIQARCPAAQARALRRETRFGHGERHRAGARIDAKPQPARARIDPKRHRGPSDHRLRGGGRRDDVQDRPLHLPRSSSPAPTCPPRAPLRGRR